MVQSAIATAEKLRKLRIPSDGRWDFSGLRRRSDTTGVWIRRGSIPVDFASVLVTLGLYGCSCSACHLSSIQKCGCLGTG